MIPRDLSDQWTCRIGSNISGIGGNAGGPIHDAEHQGPQPETDQIDIYVGPPSGSPVSDISLGSLETFFGSLIVLVIVIGIIVAFGLGFGKSIVALIFISLVLKLIFY